MRPWLSSRAKRRAKKGSEGKKGGAKRRRGNDGERAIGDRPSGHSPKF